MEKEIQPSKAGKKEKSRYTIGQDSTATFLLRD
ncbi:hypothetical protein QFZ31_004765 [Neobacillus niacini]|nr:hypothetical protein [Neobacillus niacini]